MHPLMKVLRNLTWLTQLGMSIIAPPVLCIGVCFWLQHRFSLGVWIMLLGVVLGLGAALSSAFRFGQMVLNQAEKESAAQPRSYNDHE